MFGIVECVYPGNTWKRFEADVAAVCSRVADHLGSWRQRCESQQDEPRHPVEVGEVLQDGGDVAASNLVSLVESRLQRTPLAKAVDPESGSRIDPEWSRRTIHMVPPDP